MASISISLSPLVRLLVALGAISSLLLFGALNFIR